MTTALIVSPHRFAELMRDDEFRYADAYNQDTAYARHYVGYAPRSTMRVYVHAQLVKEAREVVEERLVLALSLEDPPDKDDDEAEVWKARINLMGWTFEGGWDAVTLAFIYRARRASDNKTSVSVMLAVESSHDPAVLKLVYRKIAYAVWRMWAPTFIWLPDQDSNLEPSG